jgi:hypothetical protein
VLFIQTAALPEPNELKAALAATFARRKTHPLPVQFPQPPLAWEADYIAMAGEAQLSAATLSEGFVVVNDFWRSAQLGAPPTK